MNIVSECVLNDKKIETNEMIYADQKNGKIANENRWLIEENMCLPNIIVS